MKEKYFLINASSSSCVEIRAFESHASAHDAMKREYLECKSEVYGNDSDYLIANDEAYVQCYDGWQQHWLITSLSELAAIDTEESIESEYDDDDIDWWEE